MGGISFSGITQLFTAGTQPPHLAAVAPMSVTDDIYHGTGYPGGIFNYGFALDLDHRSAWTTPSPPPTGGQPWAKELTPTATRRRRTSRQHCIANQRAAPPDPGRAQAPDRDNPYRTPSLFNDRAPGAWLKRINVPVFLVGPVPGRADRAATSPRALEDLNGKQERLDHASRTASTPTRSARARSPAGLEFMNLFVADEIPNVPSTVTQPERRALRRTWPMPRPIPVEQSRFANYPSVAAAKADFKKDPRVRILMDNGAAIPRRPGCDRRAPGRSTIDAWPPRQAKPTALLPRHEAAR